MKEKNFEEEIAEEYVDTLLNKDDTELDKFLDENLVGLKLNEKQAGTILGAIKGVGICSFLAGLKAGKPKWHKDLPTEDIRLAIIEVEDCGYILCNYRNGFWYDDNSGAICAEWITNNIVRWKEIVLPELKESE